MYKSIRVRDNHVVDTQSEKKRKTSSSTEKVSSSDPDQEEEQSFVLLLLFKVADDGKVYCNILTSICRLIYDNKRFSRSLSISESQHLCISFFNGYTHCLPLSFLSSIRSLASSVNYSENSSSLPDLFLLFCFCV